MTITICEKFFFASNEKQIPNVNANKSQITVERRVTISQVLFALYIYKANFITQLGQ